MSTIWLLAERLLGDRRARQDFDSADGGCKEVDLRVFGLLLDFPSGLKRVVDSELRYMLDL